MFKFKLRISLPIALTVIVLTAVTAFGQSGGTDVIEAGRSYYEANFWTATQSHSNGGMQIYGGRFAYGLRKNVEVGMGFSISDPNDPEYPPEIQPSVKVKFYEKEKYGIKASGGVIGYIPVARRAGTDAFAMVYTNVSKDVKQLKDARFTVGGYALVGRNPGFGSRKGWNFVYDQPLTDKVTFSAQWVTGKNRFGYFTPGLTISMPKKSSLYIGYSVGNFDYDNHGPYISYSFYR
jgi:hypothetical protein